MVRADNAGHRKVVPLASALVVWAAAIGIGAGLGVFQHEASAAQVAALEEVESDWLVQDGTLSITVTQMGSEVTGSFSDWTADITFEEQDAPGKSGEVSVTVSIGSLTLGSVTSQAMGADFFNVEQFPTATFDADILKVEDGYEAQGTLTVKDQSVPVTLPFQLRLDGDTAEMAGRLTLDRRDFNVGQNMSDGSQLGFDVGVDVALTATRATD